MPDLETMCNSIDQVISTAGREWVMWVDSPIGRKKSSLIFTHQEGVISGAMTDLFNTILPLSNIQWEGNRLSWQLDVKRPIKVSLSFQGLLEGNVLAGRIVSKYPDIPFTCQVPTHA